VLLENGDDPKEALATGSPGAQVHVVVQCAIDVEHGGDEVHEHGDLFAGTEVASGLREDLQLVHDRSRVSAFATSRGDELAHLLLQDLLRHVLVQLPARDLRLGLHGILHLRHSSGHTGLLVALGVLFGLLLVGGGSVVNLLQPLGATFQFILCLSLIAAPLRGIVVFVTLRGP
jgi:hypothetical protein